jgi:hypothetical protein
MMRLRDQQQQSPASREQQCNCAACTSEWTSVQLDSGRRRDNKLSRIEEDRYGIRQSN